MFDQHASPETDSTFTDSEPDIPSQSTGDTSPADVPRPEPSLVELAERELAMRLGDLGLLENIRADLVATGSRWAASLDAYMNRSVRNDIAEVRNAIAQHSMSHTVTPVETNGQLPLTES